MSVVRAEKVVCVTGGAGYIASWLVKLLLLRGYTVRATLRNPGQYFFSFLFSFVNCCIRLNTKWVIAHFAGLGEERMSFRL